MTDSTEIDTDKSAQRLFNEVHRLSPIEAWNNLPEAAKDVFRQVAALPLSDRVQGVDCPDCEDATPHRHK